MPRLCKLFRGGGGERGNQRRAELKTSAMAAIRLAALLGLAGSAAGQSQLFVDCQKGSDSNVGTLTSPFRTLDRARIASHGNSAPLTINVLPGECFPATTGQTVANYSVPVLALTSIDSGTEASPVTYSAYAGPGSVRLIAGAPLNPSAWVPFKGPIVQLDLAAAGLASWGFGALTSGGLGQCTNDRAELFFGGAAMTLARYPNVPFGQRPSKASFLNVGAVGPGNPAQSFTIDNPRLLTWAAEANPWLHGVRGGIAPECLAVAEWALPSMTLLRRQTVPRSVLGRRLGGQPCSCCRVHAAWWPWNQRHRFDRPQDARAVHRGPQRALLRGEPPLRARRTGCGRETGPHALSLHSHPTFCGAQASTTSTRRRTSCTSTRLRPSRPRRRT